MRVQKAVVVDKPLNVVFGMSFGLHHDHRVGPL